MSDSKCATESSPARKIKESVPVTRWHSTISGMRFRATVARLTMFSPPEMARRMYTREGSRLCGIDRGVVAGYDARFLHAAHALGDRRRGETDPSAEFRKEIRASCCRRSGCSSLRRRAACGIGERHANFLFLTIVKFVITFVYIFGPRSNTEIAFLPVFNTSAQLNLKQEMSMATSTLQLAQPFLIEQDYGKYTPGKSAVWTELVSRRLRNWNSGRATSI